MILFNTSVNEYIKMNYTLNVGGTTVDLEDLREDLDDHDSFVVDNPLAHVPTTDGDEDSEVVYQRLDTIANNLIATKLIQEATGTTVAMESAMSLSNITLENDSGKFSWQKVKDFFAQLLRALVSLGRAIWNKIRTQCKKFFSGLMALVRNLDYMDKRFEQLSSKVTGDYGTVVDITAGPELRYLTTNTNELDLDELNENLSDLFNLVQAVKTKTLPALSELSGTINRCVLENADKNDPINLLDTLMGSLERAAPTETLPFVGVPVENKHPILSLVPVVGMVSLQRSPFITGSVNASDYYLGGVRVFFKEYPISRREARIARDTVAGLFNRVRAYQNLSVMIRREGGVDTSNRDQDEHLVTINNDPRAISKIIKKAIKLNDEFREIVKDRNVDYTENQVNLLNNSLDKMRRVMSDADYTAESMEALKLIADFTMFLNNTSAFVYQDLSILVANVTNAVGVFSRKVFSSYQ